jgi:hypothetical protein
VRSSSKILSWIQFPTAKFTLYPISNAFSLGINQLRIFLVPRRCGVHHFKSAIEDAGTMHLKVVIVCRKTQLEVPTGVIVDIKTFKEFPAGGAQFRCPACGEEHRWSVSDAQLAGLSLAESEAFVPALGLDAPR